MGKRAGRLEPYERHQSRRKVGELARQHDFGERSAGRREASGDVVEGIGRALVDFGPEVGPADADAERRGPRLNGRHGCAKGEDRRQQRDVLYRPRHVPDGIQLFGDRRHAAPAEHAETRLVADDATEGGRSDNRSRGLGAERHGHHLIRDRGRRAAR